MILYQYRGSISDDARFTYFVNLMKTGALKFSKPSEFNDPFDCFPTDVFEAPVGEIPHSVVDKLHRGLQDARSKYIGVACFTPHPDKMLMWSHYGDQHKSICVGFDAEELIANVAKNDQKHPLCTEFKEVTYTDERPTSEDNDFIYKKSLEWEYEDEYRLVSVCSRGSPEWGPGVWNIPISSIKEIVLGARIDPALEARVVNFVKSTCPNVVLKKAVIHSHTFDIVIEKLSDMPHCGSMSGVVHMPNGEWQHT